MTELRNLLAGAAGVLFVVSGTIAVAVSGHATATAGLALAARMN